MSAVPLGGYVKMLDEREGDVAPGGPAARLQPAERLASASRSSPRARSRTCCSRSLLFAGTFVAGVPGQRALLADAAAGHAAAAAGIRDGDLVVARRRRAGASWQDLRWRAAQGVRAARASTLDGRARRDGEPRRRASLSLAGARDGRLGGQLHAGARACAPTSARRSIDEVVAGQAGGARRARRRATASSRSTATPVRSPADVAARTNAQPGRAARRSASSATARRIDVTLTPEAREQGGRTVGIAGVRLKVDPGGRGAPRDHRALRLARGAGAGRAQDLGAVGRSR